MDNSLEVGSGETKTRPNVLRKWAKQKKYRQWSKNGEKPLDRENGGGGNKARTEGPKIVLVT